MESRIEPPKSALWSLSVALPAAVVIVVGALYFVLHKAAPIVAVSVDPSTKSALATPTKGVPTVEREPTLPVPSSTSSTDRLVYRCKVDGATTYSEVPCANGKVVDVRTASSGFVPQRAPVVSTTTTRIREAPQVVAAVGEDSAATAKAKRDARCAYLLAEMEQVDALARQGQSATSQDWLRERRRKLADERHALKC